jgi:hypothetical protein
MLLKIHDAAVSTLNSPKASKRLVDLGYISGGDRPDECTANIKSEIEKPAKIFHQRRLVPN